MKIIFRGDDLGMSEAVNYGIHKSVTDGVVTAVGLMSNMESAKHGAALLKDETQVSIGLHANICLGKPVSDGKKISSLMDPETNLFYKSKVINARKEDSISFDEVVIELEAQYQAFLTLVGKSPAYIDVHGAMSKKFFKAIEYIANKHNIAHLPLEFDTMSDTGVYIRPFGYFDKNYEPFSYVMKENSFYEKHRNDCIMMIFHPGYIDSTLQNNSSMVEVRVKEVEMLSSRKIKDWIEINHHEIGILNTPK